MRLLKRRGEGRIVEKGVNSVRMREGSTRPCRGRSEGRKEVVGGGVCRYLDLHLL